jgi:hypothetical protein
VPYDKSIQANYLPADITSDDYPVLVNKEQPVNIVAASTILISFNWPKGSSRYERTAKFVDAFLSKIDEFHKPPRSPLWKSVNLGPAFRPPRSGSIVSERKNRPAIDMGSSAHWHPEERCLLKIRLCAPARFIR